MLGQSRGVASGRMSLLGSDCGLASQLLPEAYIPPQVFYNGKVDYFDLQRLGGLLSHLRKTLKGVCRLVGGEPVCAGGGQSLSQLCCEC